MPRLHNSDRSGNSFSELTKAAVWRKGTIVPGYDAAVMRKDACGAWIEWAQYGVTVENGTGWEIDHIVPVASAGRDELSNLQPLQWENNRHKGDTLLGWTCARTAKA